ncbi:AAA family ATPase [Desulfovibrio sp. UCD-KL4C]|uniref:AAA family ATPase n=1 Tax=Desulfovibrio sp. UCD-KL4C TaxID=2578120 RepID=UPI0025C6FC4C|nr:AAA family ATPase [Desulfovibrio sp. UCD-KL4C]
MPLPKNTVSAVYRDEKTRRYKGNPSIEALPPKLHTQHIKKYFTGKVDFDVRDIYENDIDRIHMVSSLLDDFFQPLTMHVDFERKLSLLIRKGYVGRNLSDGSLRKHLQNGYERIMDGDLEARVFKGSSSTASSMLLTGVPGCGKSSTVNLILSTYPQVIFHEKYNFTQLVYLKIDCPHDGGIKNLCINFFRALDRVLDTDYETIYVKKRHNIETLLSLIPQVANKYGLGVLVIDEIQHLYGRSSGGAGNMMSFFVAMENSIGLPVVFIGTPKAREIFERELRLGRRILGAGSLTWEPMENRQVINPESGKIKKNEWHFFTDVLWKYQWLKERDLVLSEEIRDCWYDLSQGIHDIVVKLFVLAQIRAITTKTERITPKLMEKVYYDDLKPVHSILGALRSKDPERIAQYEDLTLPGIEKRILKLSTVITDALNKEDFPRVDYNGNKDALRLHNLLLAANCEESRVIPLVQKVFDEHPDVSIHELLRIVLDWYGSNDSKEKELKPKVIKSIPQSKWNTLESNDLRFKLSQNNDGDLYNRLKKDSLIFDVNSWLQ